MEIFFRPIYWCSYIHIISRVKFLPTDLINQLTLPRSNEFDQSTNELRINEHETEGEEDMERAIRGVPGMEDFLRCRDLPSFCRVNDVTNDRYLNMVVHQTHQSPRAQALILNTFDDLEGPIISHVRTKCPNVYPVGPLGAHLTARLAEATGSRSTPLTSRESNLFDLDRSCMTWLDAQPPSSVVYVSFGSIAVLTEDDLLEFLHGLVNSKKRFLWVAREDLLRPLPAIARELSEAVEERGFVAGWVPQEEVLCHVAVGGFLTHSGWNSTLESVVAGVPMLCWPYFADQQTNSRFVGEVWKLGIDMKDVCDRNVIEKMVNDLMVDRREEFQRSAIEMASLAEKSVGPGGSSYCSFDRLIQSLKFMGNLH